MLFRSISQWLAEEKKLSLHKWEHPISVYNIDGTENSNGKITHYAEMKMIVDGHSEIRKFAITNLGQSDVFLGHEWLNFHNLEVDWNTGSLQFTRCPTMCGYMETEDVEEGDRIWMKYPKPLQNVRRNKAFIRAHQSISNSLAEEFERNKKMDPIPEQYKGFEEVFEKAEFDTLPPKWPWDHAIELKPGSEPTGCKIYPLNLDEQRELDTFLEEHLHTGCIQPSKSPMASPFFFVKKKDGRLRPIQDYQKLNDMTIKN